ncbi:sulfotransferase family 2 domain-containing protein [Paracoccus aerodenitrificans]|uniref:sulfotransferase family 2 domain-containing protein n=1 Tax=Paracoccus aerodenitrificans TaxID=3017781 RepID=UPI0022F0511F|nr:sulfotransferase family 2 domain-containing protein [Paracoccus aerodenitrificans]WBU64994.1 sulfotransferase family 2 domain-containing protein [Paracoccus aerodenitrificans]
MLIFWEQRLVFLATPKAGSTAIEVALEPLASLAVQHPPEMKHADASRFHRHIHPWLQDLTDDHFTTVALMREPIEWLRSWYRFHLRDEPESDGALPENGFEGFVRRYLDNPKSVTQGIGAQADFLTAGEARIDRIFRYEHIDAFTRFLDEWLDCEISLPRVNVPPSADVSLTPETDATLRQALARDFGLYESLT